MTTETIITSGHYSFRLVGREMYGHHEHWEHDHICTLVDERHAQDVADCYADSYDAEGPFWDGGVATMRSSWNREKAIESGWIEDE